jgi:hypothetical protein
VCTWTTPGTRLTRLPARKRLTFTTVVDNQTAIEVHVEGMRPVFSVTPEALAHGRELPVAHSADIVIGKRSPKPCQAVFDEATAHEPSPHPLDHRPQRAMLPSEADGPELQQLLEVLLDQTEQR